MRWPDSDDDATLNNIKDVSNESEGIEFLSETASVQSLSIKSASDAIVSEAEDEAEASGNELAVAKVLEAKLLEQARVTLVFDGANISVWVRQAQSHLVTQCERGEAPDWKKSDIADILLLNNIVVFSEMYLPTFVDLGAAHGFKDTMKDHLKKALNIDAPTANDIDPYDAIQKRERMQSFAIARQGFHKQPQSEERKKTGTDEDTEVYAVLHTLLDEVFKHPALVVRWWGKRSERRRNMLYSQLAFF
ncbi:hypothetical protein HDU87_007443 [Geranomyces variabilis]|uniref:Uncharacterized protein n=1 Tax=Geranomyces variabilis TaxID=109894 RepID=A0AAD5XQ87_9FUNG|nr:hypothetical protein HDU87_007443 [Geranomyces variabilis]